MNHSTDLPNNEYDYPAKTGFADNTAPIPASKPSTPKKFTEQQGDLLKRSEKGTEDDFSRNSPGIEKDVPMKHTEQ